MLINAISIGDVKTPIIEKNIPSNPAKYSCLVTASTPKIKASGLNKGDRIKIPTKPNITLIVP